MVCSIGASYVQSIFYSLNQKIFLNFFWHWSPHEILASAWRKGVDWTLVQKKILPHKLLTKNRSVWMQFVDHDQILQRSGSKEKCIALFQWHCRTEFRFVIIVTKVSDLIQVTENGNRFDEHGWFVTQSCQHLLVAKIRCNEQETSFHDTHCRCRWNRIEIFQFDFRNDFIVSFQCHFEYVTLFGLHQKEVHRFGSMRCRRNEYHAAFRIVQIISTTRYRTPDVMLIAKIFVCQIVFGTDEHTGWAIVAAGNGDQKICMLFEWFEVFANDMIQTQI